MQAATDDEIHAALVNDPDIQPTDEALGKNAHIVMPKREETVTMRLYADLLN